MSKSKHGVTVTVTDITKQSYAIDKICISFIFVYNDKQIYRSAYIRDGKYKNNDDLSSFALKAIGKSLEQYFKDIDVGHNIRELRQTIVGKEFDL